MKLGTPLCKPYPDPYADHSEEKRARRSEANGARLAKRGDGRGAQNAMRFADAIRREAGLPDHHAQIAARDAWINRELGR
jgi:hypothetical protein